MDDSEVESYQFYLLVLLLFFIGITAAAGGIGGGGVIVPILLVLGGYTFKESAVFSLTSVMGNHVAQGILNWKYPHPLIRQRPLIYWDAVLILLPSLLGGSNIGVLIAKVAPATPLEVLAVLTLLFAIYKATNKGIQYYRQETGSPEVKYHKVSSAMESHLSDSSTNTTQSLLHPASTVISIAAGGAGKLFGGQSHARQTLDEQIDNRHYSRDLKSNRFQSGGENSNDVSLMEADGFAVSDLVGLTPSRQPSVDDVLPSMSSTALQFQIIFPWTTMQALALVWIYYVTMFVIIQYTTDSTCSFAYFALLGSIYPILLVIVFYALQHVAKKQVVDEHFSLAPGDLDFRTMSYFVPIIAFCVGILCSLLGIGGGELMGPLLLALGVLPQVSTATSSIMSLLTSGNTIVHYAILGEYNFSFVWLLIVIR